MTVLIILKLTAVRTFETSGSNNPTTRRSNQECLLPQQPHSINLKSLYRTVQNITVSQLLLTSLFIVSCWCTTGVECNNDTMKFS